jgi:hypothetical protein
MRRRGPAVFDVQHLCQNTVLRSAAPAMPNGRYRLHGGKSSGPPPPEVLQRCRVANWKHGMYVKEALAKRRAACGARPATSYGSCRRPCDSR